MHRFLALAVVLFVQTAFAETPNFGWLMDNVNAETLEVTVVGQKPSGLNQKPNLAQVLDWIVDIERNNLFHLITTDRCVRNLRGPGIRCTVIFVESYMIQYRLQEEGGQLVVVPPARLLVN